MTIVAIIFWLAVASLLYNYIGFPLIMNYLSKGKKQNQDCFLATEELPMVSILLAVYNEEKVIEEKIKATFKTGYPLDKIELLIGSDASTDQTDEIIKKYLKNTTLS